MKPARAQSGLTYTEVLVTTFLIGVALVPAIDALSTGRSGAIVHEQRAVLHHHLHGKLEQVLAQPFSALDSAALAAGSPAVETGFSDAAGAPDRRLVFIARYDGDEADGDGDRLTGGDDGLLWIRVEIPGTNLAVESLTAR